MLEHIDIASAQNSVLGERLALVIILFLELMNLLLSKIKVEFDQYLHIVKFFLLVRAFDSLISKLKDF